MILITGATGNVGSELIAALLPAKAGHIRVLTRNPGAVFPDGTQKAIADLGDSDLAPVLDGVDAVFLLTDGLSIAAHDHRLVAAARLVTVCAGTILGLYGAFLCRLRDQDRVRA